MIAVVSLVVLLASWFPSALDSEDGMMHVVYLVALLALVSTGVLIRRRTSFRRGATQAAIWLAIGVVLVAVYGYRFELAGVRDRVLGELLPGRGISDGSGVVRFRAGENGHFHVDAVVDGVSIRFLVDTGASDVVLSAADARRLGFDLDKLAYSRTYATANGLIQGAPVRLHEVRIGPIRKADVAASVSVAPLWRSLLGMSFLERLGGFEMAEGTLTLRQ